MAFRAASTLERAAVLAAAGPVGLHHGTPTRSLACALWLGSHGLSAAVGALSWIPSLITDIWGAILLAAPKRRTTHRTKRTRQNAPENKLENRRDITQCPFCGEPKLLRHLCMRCYETVKEKYKDVLGGVTRR
ncbi:hypothetical protein DFJ74DRAFT_669996 [Hyaloraphidium curvatum]|nr:hypothetical protein DFJ74DRAFT_669996 [Hyaloraphidium curvatum]